MSQNKNKIENKVYFQKRFVYQILAIFYFLPNNFYLESFQPNPINLGIYVKIKESFLKKNSIRSNLTF